MTTLAVALSESFIHLKLMWRKRDQVSLFELKVHEQS